MQELNEAKYSTLLLMEDNEDAKKVHFNDGAVLSSIRATVLARIKKMDIYNSHIRTEKNKYGTLTDPEEIIFGGEHGDLRYTGFINTFYFYPTSVKPAVPLLRFYTVEPVDEERLLCALRKTYRLHYYLTLKPVLDEKGVPYFLENPQQILYL